MAMKPKSFRIKYDNVVTDDYSYDPGGDSYIYTFIYATNENGETKEHTFVDVPDCLIKAKELIADGYQLLSAPWCLTQYLIEKHEHTS
jgi:hypothetical protein